MKDFRKYCDISDLDDELKLTYNYKDFILTITDKYLKGLKEEVSLKVIKHDIFELTNNMIDIYNLEVSKKSNLRKYPNMISLNAL